MDEVINVWSLMSLTFHQHREDKQLRSSEVGLNLGDYSVCLQNQMERKSSDGHGKALKGAAYPSLGLVPMAVLAAALHLVSCVDPAAHQEDEIGWLVTK